MIGQTLGRRYRISALLGRGGMGVVYAGEDVETLERVAVKVLHSHLVEAGGEGPLRFAREAEAARAIHDEHIVRVLDAGTDEATGSSYLVTEHLDGEDLQRVLDRAGVLSLGGVLRMAAQVLAGVAAAHEARVVHRDIKPANIFLAKGPDGGLLVKLLDFGIAKVRPDPLSFAADLTHSGAILGSPLYMSPEQVQNSREVDHRTDLWSVGCVLYAALAGRAPHQHLATIGQLLVATCTAPPPPLSEVAPWVPREVADAVHRALTIDVAARYPSAKAMLDAIGPLVPPGPLTPEVLAESSERPGASSRDAPRSPALPAHRVTVGQSISERVHGDDETRHASPTLDVAARARSTPPEPTTLRSGPSVEGPAGRGSAVPLLAAKSGARMITVDPRRVLGEQTELWTFSLEVHRHLPSLIARIWKSLRRAGAKIPPMTYGTSWVLFEPRTGRTIAAAPEDGEAPSLEDAGIRPGIILWILPPDAVPESD